MENFDELLKNAVNQTVDELSNQIIDNVKNGEPFNYEISNTLDDILFERIYEIADQSLPVYDSDILKLAATDLNRVSQAYDRALSEQGSEIINNGDRNFNGILNVGIYYMIEQHLGDSIEEIRSLVEQDVIKGLSEPYSETQLNSAEFILNEIREKEQPWPFILALDNIKDNPIVLLEAASMDTWVCKYASDRLKELCDNNDPIAALESLILNNQLNKELNKGTQKRNSNKL